MTDPAKGLLGAELAQTSCAAPVAADLPSLKPLGPRIFQGLCEQLGDPGMYGPEAFTELYQGTAYRVQPLIEPGRAPSWAAARLDRFEAFVQAAAQRRCLAADLGRGGAALAYSALQSLFPQAYRLHLRPGRGLVRLSFEASPGDWDRLRPLLERRQSACSGPDSTAAGSAVPAEFLSAARAAFSGSEAEWQQSGRRRAKAAYSSFGA